MNTYRSTSCFFRSICPALALVLVFSCAEKPENPGPKPNEPVEKPETTTYPSVIEVMSQDLPLYDGWTNMLEVKVKPADATFDINEMSLALTDENGGGSSIPENFSLSKIEPSTDAFGNVIAGQYKIYIKDNSVSGSYKEKSKLVLATKDAHGSDTEILSSSITIYNSALPTVIVSTPDGVRITSKEDWVKGTTITIVNTEKGEFDMTYENANIRGRGNTTWSYPKKPYAIKLDKKAEVLGMPKHKRWVLLANWMDRTCMRNAVAFEVARRTKGLDWTPRGEFVEVVLNGEFLGNYFLCEQIKLDENRVNIAEMESTDIDNESITGGYLLELDTYFDEVNKFRSNFGTYDGVAGLPVNIKDPDEDVLVAEQFDYIRDYFCKAEQAVYTDLSTNKTYLEYIDIDSFIDWWFVHELTGNEEPKHPKSSYMHKDRNGKLKAGPVWDFDWGTFMPDMNRYAAKNSIWYHKFFRDPDFVARVKEKWAESKDDFKAVGDYINETAGYISISADANTAQWPIDMYVNGDEKLSFDESVKRLRSAYLQRYQWLDFEIGAL